jgi:two-component system sensor histidine kinase HydH
MQNSPVGQITGFGVYDGRGALAYGMGSVPDSIDPDEVGETNNAYSYHADDKMVTLVRRVAVLEPSFAGSPIFPTRRATRAYLCVKVYAPKLFARQRVYDAGLTIIPVLLVAMVVLLFLLDYRNWSYRRTLDAQRGLVHMGEVARTLSHEIRNPVSAVQIQTELLKRRLGPNGADEVGVIEEELQRIGVLLDRTSDFLRKPEGEPERIDLQRFIPELLGRFEWPVSMTGLSELGAGEAAVSFDRQRLRSVIENVVRNAVESGDDGRQPDVELSVTASRGWVRICVRDNGSGLPSVDTGTLFDPFYTTKPGGSGVGLAVSRRFVEAAGGRFSLHRRSPAGTEARIELRRRS